MDQEVLLSSGFQKEFRDCCANGSSQSHDVLLFQEGLQECSRWGALYFLWLLREKAIFVDLNKAYYFSEIRDHLKVVAQYHHQLKNILNLLISQNILVSIQDGYQCVLFEPLTTQALTEHQKKIKNRFPGLQAHCDFLKNLLDHYLLILSGQEFFLNIFFPQGSFEVLFNLYQNNVAAQFYNGLVASAVSLVVKKMASHKSAPIDILELGAGVGATSAEVLRHLSKENIHYSYTDISTVFLAHGRSILGQYQPHVTFARLDLNRSPTEQGFQESAYDLILATNAVHNAHSIKKTLKEIYGLLRPGGVLLLCEGVMKNDYSTFVYGLSSGWLNFVDPHWRIPGFPLITRQQWKELFIQQGFRSCLFLSELLERGEGLDHEVMIVEKL